MKNIIVLIKQVPNIEKVKFDRKKGKIDRSSAESEPNPFDLHALEEAVRFKDKIGGKITAISMGPPQAESTLKDALARGADRSILTDKLFAAADTWATALTLATAIKKLDSFDSIICGEKTVDGDTGQVGPEVAEILKIPHIAYVSKILERNKSDLKAVTEIWGREFVKKVKLPALLAISKDANEPHLPTLQDKMKARKAEIETWGIEDLTDTLDEEDFGIRGSKTSVKKIEVAPKIQREGEVFRGELEDSVDSLISRLESEGV